MEGPKINVLFVHHSGVFGGASRSLLEMINSFPEATICSLVLIPNGSAREAFIKLGVKTIETKGISQFDNTNYGYYRGFRWLILLREIFLLPITYKAVKRVKTEYGSDIDIIHINEITVIPAAILLNKLLKKPIVMHVRSLQRNPKGFRNKILYSIIRKYINRVIAIDQTVARSIEKNITLEVIHNGFDPLSKINSSEDSVLNEISNLKGKLKLMMVGNLLFMKGVKEFIEAAYLCQQNNLSIDFIILGDRPTSKIGIKKKAQRLLGLDHDAKKFVTEAISGYNLKNVHLIKFTSNIASAYAHCDVLCFPSHLNAVGRPVFEAAFFKKPSIVAIENAEEDTIIHMKTGLCIAEKNAEKLFDAIKYFYDNPNEVVRMGENSYELANKNFNVKNNSIKILKLYNDLLNRS